jgi:hypothetical protein
MGHSNIPGNVSADVGSGDTCVHHKNKRSRKYSAECRWDGTGHSEASAAGYASAEAVQDQVEKASGTGTPVLGWSHLPQTGNGEHEVVRGDARADGARFLVRAQ